MISQSKQKSVNRALKKDEFHIRDYVNDSDTECQKRKKIKNDSWSPSKRWTYFEILFDKRSIRKEVTDAECKSLILAKIHSLKISRLKE